MTEISELEHWFGQRLRSLRTASKWTQREMMDRMRAKGYEWHRSTIAKIESAERPIRINEAADLVSLFGISLADLLSGHKNASTSAVQQRREIEQTVRRRIATEILAKMP